MKKRIASMAVAALLAATVAVPSAEALQAASVGTSLPYVEDVNPSGGGYVATVSCAGSARARLVVTSGGKRVRVREVKPRTWLVKLERGKCYRLSVGAGGEWKSIGYRVF